MSRTPTLSIITVNYNQIAVTCALLDSIRRQSFRDCEAIVVDNGSAENPAALMAERYPEVVFIRSERNLGFAGGNNLGIAAARGRYLFFVNNDTELTESSIKPLLDTFERYPDTGAVSPLICYFPSADGAPDIVQYAGMTPVHPLTARNQTIGALQTDRGQFQTPDETAYVHGAAMMLPREAVEKTGGMPDCFFLYYEELDWCEQIKKAGYRIRVEPRARIYHKESLTVAKLGALKTYFLHRNRILFMRRNYPATLPLFLLFLLLFTIPKNTAAFILQGDRANLKAFFQALIWHVGLRNNPFEKMAAR